MWGVSAGWLEAARNSGPRLAKIEVLELGRVIAELTDLTLDGSVIIDRTAAVRRQATIRFVDDGSLTVADAEALLAPYGNEIRPWIGYQHSGLAEPEWAPLGTLRVSKPRTRETKNGVEIAVTAFDRARTVQRSRWTAPYALTADATVEATIEAILEDRIAGAFPLVTSFPTVGESVPAGVLGEEPTADPWVDVQRMALDSGYELYFDAMGVATLRVEPDPTATPPVFTLYGGDEDATLLELGRDLDDERGYNGVIVTAEGSHIATPLRSEVWDTDPTSPTYYLGKYGKVPLFYSSPLIRRQGQADRAARSRLQRVLGISEQVDFGALTNAALDASDVLRIERDSVAVNGNYVLERLTIPLDVAGAMSGITRSRRVLL